MIPLTSLLLPIVLAAVLVFLASSVLHMVLPHHRSDLRRLPDEDRLMAAFRDTGVPPGDFMMPHSASPAEMKSPEYIAKRDRGPIAVMTVFDGNPSMGTSLGLWFVYCLAVSIFAGYVTGRALGPGAEYMQVFRFAGTTAFAGYALALWQETIWYRRNWTTTLKSNFDGLIYGLLTAGVFGWLWPA